MKVHVFDGYEHLPNEVGPEDLVGLVEQEAPKMRQYPGHETHAAELLVRETYGVGPMPGPRGRDTWWGRSWAERAVQLVKDGWARIRELAGAAKPAEDPIVAVSGARQAQEQQRRIEELEAEVAARRAYLRRLDHQAAAHASRDLELRAPRVDPAFTAAFGGGDQELEQQPKPREQRIQELEAEVRELDQAIVRKLAQEGRRVPPDAPGRDPDRDPGRGR